MASMVHFSENHQLDLWKRYNCKSVIKDIRKCINYWSFSGMRLYVHFAKEYRRPATEGIWRHTITVSQRLRQWTGCTLISDPTVILHQKSQGTIVVIKCFSLKNIHTFNCKGLWMIHVLFCLIDLGLLINN